MTLIWKSQFIRYNPSKKNFHFYTRKKNLSHNNTTTYNARINSINDTNNVKYNVNGKLLDTMIHIREAKQLIKINEWKVERVENVVINNDVNLPVCNLAERSILDL